MRFRVVEVDRDYRVVTNWWYQEFSSKKEAGEWCRNETWTGYAYYAYPLAKGET